MNLSFVSAQASPYQFLKTSGIVIDSGDSQPGPGQQEDSAVAQEPSAEEPAEDNAGTEEEPPCEQPAEEEDSETDEPSSKKPSEEDSESDKPSSEVETVEEDLAAAALGVMLSVPGRLDFSVVRLSFDDIIVPAAGEHTLSVQGIQGGWTVLASFEGFSQQGADHPLPACELLINNVGLENTPRKIAFGTGEKTVGLDVYLRVLAGQARQGTYEGAVNWILVDAP